MGRPLPDRSIRPRTLTWARFVLHLAPALGLALAFSAMVHAAPTGRLQGRIVATDTGEPIGFADVLLIPEDTTLTKVGSLTNADGTYLLVAAPGRYTLQIRALSYERKRIEGVVLDADRLATFSTALAPEAIQQEEVVIEAKAVQNSEASMLSARKKAPAVGDAVSAEQVRKSPDKDAAEVLRRVTGLSVADGKYVFVRGLGERYSSVEVDGVRIASPEQNKRVVPLDLVPASLLDNIVVQKTHTADRPGEFGGGDVQVHMKDFPGKRTWSFSLSQGYVEGVTLEDRRTYAGSSADAFGFGAGARVIPRGVADVAGDQPLLRGNFPVATLAAAARSFSNVWSPTGDHTAPNSSYTASYGDELRIGGRPLGFIASASLWRGFDQEDLSHRYFQSSLQDTVYDYAVTRFTESVQLGGLAGLSYRLSPRHTVHVRGFYTNSSDDEVRIYEGPDHNRNDATGGYLVHRNTRLMYVQRNILSGTVEGKHEIAQVLGSTFDWKLTRSRAQRQQPDRREVTYDHNYYYDGDGNAVGYWSLGSTGIREYGDLEDKGWGVTLSSSVPYRLGSLGKGKLVVGFDRQTKERENFYRRFNFTPRAGSDPTLPPDSLFGPGAFTGGSGTGYVEEATLDIDNYHANQCVTAGYIASDVPLGRRLRGNLGVRVESGFQEVDTYDLFDPGRITETGALDNVDWLPSANLTWAMTDAVNLRAGASRTISRPDLNELSPSPALEYVAGLRIAGNPDLRRALIDNYDLRLEAFPGLSEVLAAGVFYKYLHQPIEQAIQGGTPPLLVPRNSDSGHNMGLELEARAGLDRLWKRLNGIAVNANASVISSEVKLLPQTSRLGTGEHPLQGQAAFLVNGALTYASPGGRTDFAVMLSATGRRLKTLALDPLPDVYEEGTTSLDATWGFVPLRGARVKLSAKNLLDPRIRQTQGPVEVSGYHGGRSYTVALSYGL